MRNLQNGIIAPSTSLDVGDLYFDTTANELKVYKSSGWAAAGSTVNGTSQDILTIFQEHLAPYQAQMQTETLLLMTQATLTFM